MTFSTNEKLFILSATLAATALAVFAFTVTQFAHASAPSGLQATIATSSNPAVPANSAIVLVATSTCSARIIATASTTLMLTFLDKDTPTAAFGVFQAASTTVAYDSGQYGCGQVKGYSNAAGVVTVMDAR